MAGDRGPVVSEKADEATETVPTVPTVTIEAVAAQVTEGAQVEFTVRATPAPTADLMVTVSVTETGGNMLAGGPRTETLTIGMSGSATLALDTVPDGTDEDDSVVTATLIAGSGYALGTASSVMVTVTDEATETVPTVTIEAVAAQVTEGAQVTRARRWRSRCGRRLRRRRTWW